jgi:phospholipid/cholesterol/gamma-HCH transport system permease protein
MNPGSTLVRRHLTPVGEMYTMWAKALFALGDDIVHRRFEWGEFLRRCWFLANATALPVLLVSVPLGMAIVLQVGGVAGQLGATSFVGAADALGVLRQAAPIVTALLLAGVGGSAVCAELGARTMREEIDALEVMGIDPLRRIVAPLLLASLVTSLFLVLLVMFISITSGYYFFLLVLHGTPGSFLGTFADFASMTDLFTSMFKAAVFGVSAGLIAAYNGLNARGGPAAVGEAVNRTVVIAGIVLFAENLVITQVFFALFPQKLF